jgi:mevalonate kinase
LRQRFLLSDAPKNDPLAATVRLTMQSLRLPEPDVTLTLTSTIPIARGLGSGAAVSTAVVKALGRFTGRELPPQTVSEIVFEVEKIFHGTPSGIDNTVVAYAQPVFFCKGYPVQRFSVGAPMTLLIGDTGLKSPTYKVVGNLRERRQQSPVRYNAFFEQMGQIARQAKQAIEQGNLVETGRLMTENHRLLRQTGVSAPELNWLVNAALSAGALGAKLSGAGWGGNMIALVSPEKAAIAADALRMNGAAKVIITRLKPQT